MKINFNGIYSLKLILVICTFIAACSVISIASPLNSNNRFPALLMFLTPSPDAPGTLESGPFNLSASIDYTSVFIDEETDDWEVLMDFEMTTVSVLFEFAPCDGVSVSAVTSFVDMGTGFLDGFLDEYHSAGSFPDYGRSERPHNEFNYYMMETDGPYWLQVENEGFKVADSVVSVKVRLSKESALFKDSGYSFSSAVKYSLKIPVGDFEQGLSSKGYDHGFFLLTQFSRDRVIYYFNPGFVLLEQPETLGADVSITNMATFFTGVSYLLNAKWTLHAQLNCFTSPFDTGIKIFDNPGVELTFGFHYKYTKRLGFEFAFSEDLAGPVPDFTVHSGVVCNF